MLGLGLGLVLQLELGLGLDLRFRVRVGVRVTVRVGVRVRARRQVQTVWEVRGGARGITRRRDMVRPTVDCVATAGSLVSAPCQVTIAMRGCT